MDVNGGQRGMVSGLTCWTYVRQTSSGFEPRSITGAPGGRPEASHCKTLTMPAVIARFSTEEESPPHPDARVPGPRGNLGPFSCAPIGKTS